MTVVVELRCDRDPQRLFGKLIQTEKPRIDPATNLLEFACDKCRREFGVRRVLHRFNILGDLVETLRVKDLEITPGRDESV